MMYDDKLVIVEMDTMTTYGFAEKGETADEAIQRANQYYTNDLKHLKVMETDKFQKIERERILSGKLNRVTEQEYEDALNVLPPLYWCTVNGVEMFCMSEMYSDTYTTQYAYDHRTGKYYCKMVDSEDTSTWIHTLLRKC